jgi:signal transduction histidine kinase
MNHYQRFARQVNWVTFLLIFLPGALCLTGFILMREVLEASLWKSVVVCGSLYISISLFTFSALRDYLLSPLEKIWQAVWHISPGNQQVPAPKIDDLQQGRELVSSLITEIYDLASSSPRVNIKSEDGKPLPLPLGKTILEQLPIAVFVLDKEHKVKATNQVGLELINLPAEKVIDQSIYDVLRLSFTSADTFDTWLEQASSQRATDIRSWEHVKIQLDEKTVKQIDMAASYSRDNSEGNEIVITAFDHTVTYQHQDEAYGYVALAVHELRTPLTVLRGYIEVFEDELGGQLTPELREFMRKMGAASQSLTAFVSNILNVARVDENQLVLSLQEAEWNKVLPEILKDLELRASVRGKVIELDIEENLPRVAIDKISMYEVISNLIDNAIKYSGHSPKIVVHARKSKDGTIETVIQDFGVGIPESSLSGLFSKFYRSHHSKDAVSGSGLGLYLVKAIVAAHGGNVWVNSKEGEGSSFGFSVQAYESMSTIGNKDEEGIERHANGWIKNHSFYRR